MADCESGWTYDASHGNCYKIFEDRLNWQSSKVSCRQKGGDLASITSSVQQQVIAGETTILARTCIASMSSST